MTHVMHENRHGMERENSDFQQLQSGRTCSITWMPVDQIKIELWFIHVRQPNSIAK